MGEPVRRQRERVLGALRGGGIGCLAAAVRAVVVVVGTWLGLTLTLLLLLVLSLIPGGRQQNNLATLLVGLWMLTMFVGPIVAGFILRFWITGGPDVRPTGRINPARSSGRRGGYGERGGYGGRR